MKKLWKSFKQKLIRLLQDKEEEIEAATPELPTTSNPISKRPGLDCPKCHYRISVKMEDLVIQNAVTCDNCKLVLKVDLNHSKTSIEELRKVYTAIQKAEKFKETVK